MWAVAGAGCGVRLAAAPARRRRDRAPAPSSRSSRCGRSAATSCSSPRFAGPVLVGIVVTAVLDDWVNGPVIDPAQYDSGALLDGLFTGHGLHLLVITAAGQVFYLSAATLGIATLGVLELVAGCGRSSRTASRRCSRCGAGLRLRHLGRHQRPRQPRRPVALRPLQRGRDRTAADGRLRGRSRGAASRCSAGATSRRRRHHARQRPRLLRPGRSRAAPRRAVLPGDGARHRSGAPPDRLARPAPDRRRGLHQHLPRGGRAPVRRRVVPIALVGLVFLCRRQEHARLLPAAVAGAVAGARRSQARSTAWPRPGRSAASATTAAPRASSTARTTSSSRRPGYVEFGARSGAARAAMVISGGPIATTFPGAKGDRERSEPAGERSVPARTPGPPRGGRRLAPADRHAERYRERRGRRAPVRALLCAAPSPIGARSCAPLPRGKRLRTDSLPQTWKGARDTEVALQRPTQLSAVTQRRPARNNPHVPRRRDGDTRPRRASPRRRTSRTGAREPGRAPARRPRAQQAHKTSSSTMSVMPPNSARHHGHQKLIASSDTTPALPSRRGVDHGRQDERVGVQGDYSCAAARRSPRPATRTVQLARRAAGEALQRRSLRARRRRSAGAPPAPAAAAPAHAASRARPCADRPAHEQDWNVSPRRRAILSGEGRDGARTRITSTRTGAIVRSASARWPRKIATTSAGEVDGPGDEPAQQPRLAPELQLDAVERAHDRRPVTRLGGPAEQHVRNRPVHVDDVVPPSPRDPVGGRHARQHVRDGHRLVAQGAAPRGRPRLVVRQFLVALRRERKRVTGMPRNDPEAEPRYDEVEHLGLDALGPERTSSRPARARSVALEPRKRRRDVENADPRRLALTGLRADPPDTPAPWWRERLWP